MERSGQMGLTAIVPGMLRELNVPDSHHIGYVMVLGKPAIQYHRMVQRGDPHINRVISGNNSPACRKVR